MTTHSNEKLKDWEVTARTKRNYLGFAQYHLVLVRGLMNQMGMTNDQAHLLALSRYPMSSHAVCDELAVRGLSVSLNDIEEYWFELNNELIDTKRLQWSAKSIENFVSWAVGLGRAKPIADRTPHIQRLLQDREFIVAAHEIEAKIFELSEME